MTLTRYTKHPSEIRAYPIDVTNLSPNTIGVVSGTASPAGLTVASVTASGARVTALISGGVSSSTPYQVEITINISNGERLIQEFEIMVTDN